MVNLVEDTIDRADIKRLINWLETFPRLTNGPITIDFEKKWADYIGVEESIFVNSGSSANLVMLQVLIETGKIKKGDTVVVPALAWSTNFSPVVQLGLNPVLCDCNLDDLSIDLSHFEKICKSHDVAALMFVSILGLVPNMDNLLKVCNKYEVILLEDACESFGSKFKDRKLGTFGAMSSFSTYFGHHLSTIEGGIICTNDKDLADAARCIRNHGWDRDFSEDKKLELREKWGVSEFDSLYTFYMHGFNVRSTDLQAFIGLGQLDKGDKVNTKREINFKKYQNQIHNPYWKPKDYSDRFISNFAYPIIHPERDAIVKNLMKEKVEVRPMICRSIGVQPFYVRDFGRLSLKNADIIDRFGMYVPNHPGLKSAEIQTISSIVNEAIGSQT
jgi:CDP-4-dehydro-6-deoxyglucose reductase, E1